MSSPLKNLIDSLLEPYRADVMHHDDLSTMRDAAAVLKSLTEADGSLPVIAYYEHGTKASSKKLGRRLAWPEDRVDTRAKSVDHVSHETTYSEALVRHSDSMLVNAHNAATVLELNNLVTSLRSGVSVAKATKSKSKRWVR